MPKNADWLPTRREAQLAMAKDWGEVLSAKATAWSVPAAEVTTLGTLAGEAGSALDAAQSSERTAVVTANCKAAFEALVEKMRFIKSRYFLSPPLSDTDLVSLELKPKDTTHTPVPPPVNQPGIEIIKWAPHTLGFRRFTAAVLGGGEEDYGIRVYYALTETGAAATPEKPSAARLADNMYLLSAPPVTPADLPGSFFTRRAKDLLELSPEASGKTCYLAARFENSKGERGPWGTMISAIVP
jgi:hypothetical protein